MSIARLSDPENFVRVDRQFWSCLRCNDAPETMTARNAVIHGGTAKHRRATDRYIASLEAANVAAIEDTPAGVMMVDDHPAGDPFLDMLNTYSQVGHSTHPSPSPVPSPPPRHSPQMASPVGPSAIQVDDFTPNAYLAHRSHRTAVREAVNRALDAFLLNEDSEDEDEGSGDVEDTFLPPPPDVPAEKHSLPSVRRRGLPRSSSTGVWSPWPDRSSCTLDIVSQLPRSVFSHKDLEVMLWLLGINGVTDVPTISNIKSTSAVMEGLCGVGISRHLGSLGHTYHIIKPSSMIALDFSNPAVRNVLEVYPEDTGQVLTSATQASRWLHDVDPRQLTPMHRVGLNDYFIMEPTRLHDGTMCIPTRWYKKAGVMMCRAWRMVTLNGGWVVERWDELTFSDNQLLLSGSDIHNGAYLGPGVPSATQIAGMRDASNEALLQPWPYPLLNEWRNKAKGSRVVAYPAWLYCDDTSGNRSKKWNEHNSFLMVAAGLPREHAHKEANVHFLCTSNAAPPLEMLEGLVEDIEECQAGGVQVYDCLYGETVLVILWILALLGDNPMQSEFACHSGLRSKFFCRSCWVKGKDGDDMEEFDGAVKKGETFAGMVDRVRRFMQVGKAREPVETQKTSREIFENVVGMEPQKQNQILRTSTGIKDKFLHYFVDKIDNARKKLSGPRAEAATHRILSTMPTQPYSPVWRIKDLNPHSDTPVEILHVVLLGFVKYFWRDAIERLSDEQKGTLKVRLTSMDMSGLDPRIGSLRGHTLVQYAGSLVGRDFKIVEQIAIFALYDLLDDSILQTWAALAALVPLIWQPRIDNLDEYLAKLESAVDRFLNCTARWTPRWFNKPKFHLLLHLVAHIRRFGPAILFATEVFEAFNAIIRAWSIHSNRQAPSLDIAKHAAGLVRIRHLLSGGFYEEKFESEDGSETLVTWRQAGSSVIALGQTPSIVSARLGLSPPSRSQKGAVRYKKASSIIDWSDTISSQYYRPPPGGSKFREGADIVLDNEDRVSIDDFVVYKVINGDYRVAKIREILSRLEGAITLVEVFNTGELALPYSMPTIRSSQEYYMAAPSDLLCAANIQHNCAAHPCDLSGSRPVFLERERLPDNSLAVRHHGDLADLVLNTGKMRDAWIIQRFVQAVSTLDHEEIIHMAVRDDIAKAL